MRTLKLCRHGHIHVLGEPGNEARLVELLLLYSLVPMPPPFVVLQFGRCFFVDEHIRTVYICEEPSATADTS